MIAHARHRKTLMRPRGVEDPVWKGKKFRLTPANDPHSPDLSHACMRRARALGVIELWEHKEPTVT